MKRNVFFICILISTLLGIIPKNGSCNLMSIKELQQTTSEKWTESITVNSKEFDINIPVNVPSVEAIPIINVTGRETDENGIKEYENIGVSLLDKWENAINLFMDKEETKENARVFPYKIQNDFWQIEKENDTINMYAKEQENSLAFVIDKMEKMFGKIYNCEENEIWVEKVQFRKNYISAEKVTTEQLWSIAGEGDYKITGRQNIRGIPILIPISGAYSDGMDECKWTNYAWNEIEFFYKNENKFGFISTGIMEEQDELYNDILLCDIETIKNNVREYIVDGKIDQIYSMELGYVLYADPEKLKVKGSKLNEFTLFPTWVIKCRYIDGKDKAQIETPGIESETYDYKNERCFQYLLANAQTGKICNPHQRGLEKYYTPQIIN